MGFTDEYGGKDVGYGAFRDAEKGLIRMAPGEN